MMAWQLLNERDALHPWGGGGGLPSEKVGDARGQNLEFWYRLGC